MTKKQIIFSFIVVFGLIILYLVFRNTKTNDYLIIPEEIGEEEYNIPDVIADTFYCEEGNCSLIIEEDSVIIYLYYISELEEFGVTEEGELITKNWIYNINDNTLLYEAFQDDILQESQEIVIKDVTGKNEELYIYFKNKYIDIYGL